jgi:hypothetical protein
MCANSLRLSATQQKLFDNVSVRVFFKRAIFINSNSQQLVRRVHIVTLKFTL